MGLFRSLFGKKEPAPDIDLDEAEDLKPGGLARRAAMSLTPSAQSARLNRVMT